ncbi:MAG: hypothetical protein HYZ42_07230 [Bacteroidetes bacterium]|nr:hypothetical protein [Bacteroidota bacterium]
MTEKETIEHIISKKKSPRTFDDYTNYFFLVAPIAFIAIGIFMLSNHFKFESGLSVLLVGILLISLGAAFAFFILKRLNDNITFVTVSSVAKDDIDKVAERLNQQFKLQRVDVNKDLNRIIAFTKITAFSWGEQLTLVFDNDHILINSRPSGARQPLTIIKDRQNIKKLEQIL